MCGKAVKFQSKIIQLFMPNEGEFSTLKPQSTQERTTAISPLFLCVLSTLNIIHSPAQFLRCPSPTLPLSFPRLWPGNISVWLGILKKLEGSSFLLISYRFINRLFIALDNGDLAVIQKKENKSCQPNQQAASSKGKVN